MINCEVKIDYRDEDKRGDDRGHHTSTQVHGIRPGVRSEYFAKKEGEYWIFFMIKTTVDSFILAK